MRWQSGEKLSQISRSLKVDYQTLRGWAKRYREKGEPGLKACYAKCGRISKADEALREQALQYKRAHPQWGAGFIRIQLQKAFAGAYAPKERQLQRWFAQAGLQKPATRLPKFPLDWAKRPLERVQVDANEQLRTKDGKPCCYLTYTDEHTGSALEALVFPLCPH